MFNLVEFTQMGFFAEAGPVQIFVSNHVSFAFHLFISVASGLACFSLYNISPQIFLFRGIGDLRVVVYCLSVAITW